MKKPSNSLACFDDVNEFAADIFDSDYDRNLNFGTTKVAPSKYSNMTFPDYNQIAPRVANMEFDARIDTTTP